jgi:hypothetical protein
MRTMMIALACLVLTVTAGEALPAPCYAALSHGSYGRLTPCGCWTQGYVFGRYDRWMVVAGKRVNLWIADNWAHVFPRTRAHRGAVAVWPGRHVAPVVGDPEIVRGVEYVEVADSWRTHRVRTAGLIFVDPR